ARGEGLGTSAAYALDPDQTPHTYLELGALPTAVPCARLHVKHVLREWQMAQLADPVELVVAELVTNAMQASAGLTGSQFAGRWSPGLPPVRLWLPPPRKPPLVPGLGANHPPPGPRTPAPPAQTRPGPPPVRSPPRPA